MTEAVAEREAQSAMAWLEGFSAGSLGAEKLEKIRSVAPESYDRGYARGQEVAAQHPLMTTLTSDAPELD
jgi:hypothetical protein